MAKRKTKKRVGATHRRRRKVGAIKEGSIEHFALLGVGAFVGAIGSAYAVQAAQTALGATTPMWVAPGLVAGGGLAVALVGKGHPLAVGAGLGMLSIGGVMAANQFGLDVPGISGLSMASNAPASANVIRKSVGQGPNGYIKQTVGYMSKAERRVGALVSN